MLFYIQWKRSAAIIGLFLMAASLFAIEMRSPEDNEPKVTESRDYDTDYLFYGKDLDLSSKVEDLYFFGEALYFTGTSMGNVMAVGKDLVIGGEVKKDLQAGGGEILVNGVVGDSCFLAGKKIVLSPESVINGDTFIAGSEITLHGTINGNIRIGAGYVTVDGTVNGNLVIQAGELILTDRARINGNLIYDTDAALDSRAQSRVNGTITMKNFESDKKFGMDKPEKNKGDGNGFLVFILLSSLISMLGGGLLLLLIPGFGSVFTGSTGNKGFWSSVLWGLIPLFLYPVAVAVLIPLLPVSLVLFLAGVPLFSLASVLGVTRFGEYMFGVFKWKKVNRFQFFLFGLVLLAIPFLIPGISFLAFLFVSASGWGLILSILGKKKIPETV